MRQPTSQRKKASPISLRLTTEERARLEKAASGLGLSEYIRQKLFAGKDRVPRGKSVVVDYVVAAQILAKLGSSGIAASLKDLSRTAQLGGLDDKDSLALKAALGDLADIKAMLMAALGIKPG